MAPPAAVPESLLKKRKRDEEWANKKAAAAADAQKKARENRRTIFKRAEAYTNQYRRQVRARHARCPGTAPCMRKPRANVGPPTCAMPVAASAAEAVAKRVQTLGAFAAGPPPYAHPLGSPQRAARHCGQPRAKLSQRMVPALDSLFWPGTRRAAHGGRPDATLTA